MEGGRVLQNASRARILREVEDSLRRLRTDHIDIYQVHWPDPLTTIEESAEAMHTLFEQGKIRAIGVSNFSVGQMERFRRVAPVHALQPPHNLFERGIEADILSYCRKIKIATLGYGALCRGLLSSRMGPDTKFDGDDLRRTDPKIPAATLRAIYCRRRTARSPRAATLRQADHPSGDPLDAGPGDQHCAVGCAPPRPTSAGRRGERVAARCVCQG
jgi:aryl-alcohol dehydrogenase-like predicted oxidoreductase